MVHSPAQTRARLLGAAVAEFAEHGYAGARVDRICRTAGANRERLYSNFGSKRELFETVLSDRLASTLDATLVAGEGSEVAEGFATSYFDACLDAPELPRLVAWEGLELAHPVNAEQRRVRARLKVDELCAALPDLSRTEVEDLMLTVVTLCHGWVTSPNLGRIIAGDEAAHARRRTQVARVARALVER
jgi:AcrR family transcriptional regulator